MIDKHGANAGAGQQVVHVVVRPRQVRHLGLQLGVDRRQLLVDRLQFLLGRLQFLVGGLQLLVHRLHFLVGGFEFLGGTFELLMGGLEVFFLRAQFQLESRDARLGADLVESVGVRLRRAGRVGERHGHRGSYRRFLQNDQKERRLRRCGRTARHRPDGQVDEGEVAVGFDAQARARHDVFCAHSLVQGGGQVAAQAFARHPQDVADARLARRRLQKHPGTTVQVEDVALGVDERAGRDDLQQ